jgi:SAM-dependent methyltransferase
MSEEENCWENFYQKTNANPPHELLINLLGYFPQGSIPAQLRAIDLGCGAGSDTVELLKRGWNVLAIDAEPAAIKHLRIKVPVEYETRLHTQVASFDSVELSPADLVYASYSLPFCAPDRFDQLWNNILNAIKPGGRFAGQFFGVKDSWANDPEMNFHTEAQVRGRFANLEIEYFLEEDKDGDAVSGPKHWHVFHIIARKKQD